MGLRPSHARKHTCRLWSSLVLRGRTGPLCVSVVSAETTKEDQRRQLLRSRAREGSTGRPVDRHSHSSADWVTIEHLIFANYTVARFDDLMRESVVPSCLLRPASSTLLI